ncbi:MAG: hypothetical protein AB7P84_21160 [Alphaproteobacteria bacterium]
MLLEHPDLNAFEPQLRRIAETAFSGGLTALAQAGRSVRNIEHDLATYRRFIRGCHYGFGLAQSHITDAVIDLENRVRAATAPRLKAEARSAQVRLARALRNRQLVLRRVLDAILFQVLWPEHRASRYFATEDRLHDIDPVVLRRTARDAFRLNREDRMKFHVICDLTTIAQIGDLVRVDRNDPRSRQWAVIELKEGMMNEVLTGTLAARSHEHAEEDYREIAEKIGEKAVRQTQRMARQVARTENFLNILTTDRGNHPIDNLPVRVTKEREYVDDFFGAIGSVWVKAKATGFGSEIVDDCLYVMGFRADERTRAGGGYAQTAHALYHLVNEVSPKNCQLPNGGAAEVAAVKEIAGGLVDIVRHNMRDMMGYSLFLIGNPELVMDLLFERVVICMFMDFRRFFALAKEDGIALRWATRKETHRAAKLTNAIPGSPGAHGVIVTRGVADDVEEVLLYGFFRRIFGDFTPPRDLLKLLKQRTRPIDFGSQAETPAPQT